RSVDAVVGQRQSEVHSFKQAACVYPTLCRVRITIRGLKSIKRLTHARNPLMCARTAVSVRTDGSDRANHELKRTLNLRPVRFGGIELIREEDRFERFTNVAVALRESRRDTIH